MSFTSFTNWFIGSLQFYNQYGIGVREQDALIWWQPIAQWTAFCSGDSCKGGNIPQNNFNDWLHYSGNAPSGGGAGSGGSNGGDGGSSDGDGGVIVVPPPIVPPTGGGGGGSGGGGAGGSGGGSGSSNDVPDGKEPECNECDDFCNAQELRRRSGSTGVSSTSEWWDKHALTSGYYFNATENDPVKLFFNRVSCSKFPNDSKVKISFLPCETD